MAAVKGVRKSEQSRGLEGAYLAQRGERITSLLFFQATSSGFLGMEPPQARPAQPTSLGTTSWTTASYGA